MGSPAPSSLDENFDGPTSEFKLRAPAKVVDQVITSHLVFAVIASTLGSSFQHGYNAGVVNAPQEEIENWIEEVLHKRMEEKTQHSVVIIIYAVCVSIYCVGGMVGGCLTGVVAEKLGRKKGLLLNNCLVFVACILQGCSKIASSFELLIIGRFVIGINSGLNAGLVPMYLAEIAPLRMRGAVASVYQLGIVISIMFAQILGLDVCFGSDTLWPILLVLTIIPAIFQIFTLPFCPESPKYLLVTRGNEIQAEKALKWLRNRQDVGDEMSLMWSEMDSMRTMRKVTVKDFVRTEFLRKPLLIAAVIMIGQQFSGINVAIFYSTRIFIMAGLPEFEAELSTITVGVVNVAFTIVSLFLVERSGRKLLLLMGFIGMLLVAILLTICLAYVETYVAISYVCIGLLLLFVVSFAIGPGPIPWFLVTELFTHTTRPLATAIAVVINWLANFIVGLAFLPLQNLLKEYVFVIFVILLAIVVLFVWKKVPETKNKTAEEITSTFRDNEYV